MKITLNEIFATPSTSILFIIGILLFVIGIIISFYSIAKDKIKIGYELLMVIFCFGFTIIFITLSFVITKENIMNKEYQNKIEEGYSVCLCGMDLREQDAKELEINDYKVIYDEVNKKILLVK